MAAPKRLKRIYGTSGAALDRRTPAAPRYSRLIPRTQSANTRRSLAPNRRISHMRWVDAVPRHVIHARLSNEGGPPS